MVTSRPDDGVVGSMMDGSGTDSHARSPGPEEVLTRLRTIGKNGGLILGPTHHVQLDTPMENFQALVNTVSQTSYREPVERAG